MPFIRVVRAYEGEVVEIHWKLEDGTEFHQQATVPPLEHRKAVIAEGQQQLRRAWQRERADG